MADNLEGEFQGTPINLKDFGDGAFSDDEFDFLKKKPAPKPVEPQVEVARPAEVAPTEPLAVTQSQSVAVPPAATQPSAAEPPVQTSEAAPQLEPSKQPEPPWQSEPELVPTIPTIHEHQVGQIIKGKVVRIEKSAVLVDFGYKTEGVIEPIHVFMKSGETLEDLFKVGQIVEAMIISLELKDGCVLLSKKSADIERAWAMAYDAFNHKKLLEARVSSSVRGGLVVDYQGLRGFIPASQILKESAGNLDNIVGKTLPIKVIEINRQQHKIVFSHRLAAEEAHKFDQDKIMSEIEVGQVRRGRVSGIKTFGAFVNLGGKEGLIHISELSWGRVNNPAEVVKIGDEIDVFVLGVDHEKGKISLGLKQLQPDPWVKAKETYQVGQIVKGRIARLVKFGAFVELERGLEGLVHLTEMKDPAPARPEEAVKVGENVLVKILRIIPEEQKIGLSIKAAQDQANQEKFRENKPEERKVTIGDIMKEKNVQLAPQTAPTTPAPTPTPASTSTEPVAQPQPEPPEVSVTASATDSESPASEPLAAAAPVATPLAEPEII